jgi:hypothetical protein
MTNIYASDLEPSKRNDTFMGKGFEKALKTAQEHDRELIIGTFCEIDVWEEE